MLSSVFCKFLKIITLPTHPKFFFFSFFHLLILHTLPKPALALHWGAREEREKKKLVQEIFFHFKRCAKFMMRVQNGNYQAVCLPLAVWFSVVISVCFQFVVEM